MASLGYELAHVETSRLMPTGWPVVSFVHDTLEQAGLASQTPQSARAIWPVRCPHTVSINLGFADESFSVYDHPVVLDASSNIERRYDAECHHQPHRRSVRRVSGGRAT